MKCVVFVPGVLGSELENADHERVWPPKVSEMTFGYGRIDELMADDLTPVSVIRRISFFGVYRTILNDIERCGYAVGGAERRFLPFPYDWRQSNDVTAQQLADALDDLGNVSELILIGHSMGGLVSRYLLESGRFNDRDWFEAVTALITLGTPHFGAPQPLAELRGLTSILGVSGPDVRRLADDPRYPSLYQLASAPGSALTLEAAARGQIPRAIEAFSPAIVAELGLNPANVTSAQDFWADMGIDRRPHSEEADGRRVPSVDYFFFGGAAHKTTVRNQWDDAAGKLEPIERRQSGDGSVPIACSVVPELPHGFSEKVHKHVFEDRELRKALYRFLDAPLHMRPQSADATVEVGEKGRFGISVDKETYSVDDQIEIVASYNEEMTSPIESFEILAIDPDSGEPDPAIPPISFSVDFQGVELRSFSIVVSPELEPGLYELRPARPVDDPEPTYFVVVEKPNDP